MDMFERARVSSSGRPAASRVRGFTLTELLVAVAIMLALGSMAAAAVSSASGNRKKLRTRALIAKIDAIVESQYASYAGRNVEAATGAARGALLREIARGDLPDNWGVVAELAAKPAASLTAHQQAYVALWNSLDSQTRQAIAVRNADAECLFLAVMQGGLSDCLDCESLHIDVGDTDRDGMPEFVDAWDNPIGFILVPKNLRLPAGTSTNFFSASLPFDPVTVTTLEARGGMMRPLIVSAGPDGGYGLQADAAPTPGSIQSADNLTNFDEEARR